jgi:hypothetical protein
VPNSCLDDKGYSKEHNKLVSQFLELKCIFYGLYKLGLGCCGTADSPRIRADSPPVKTYARGAFHWDEHWRRRTVRENDGPFGKTTNSSGVKTLEMIPRASELQIKCGLFLWLTSNVEKVLQVMDAACMCCGKVVHQKW